MRFFWQKKKKPQSAAKKPTSAAIVVPRADAPTPTDEVRHSKPIVVPVKQGKPSFPLAAKLEWKLIIFPPQSIRAHFNADDVDIDALEQELQQGGIDFSMLLRTTKPSQLTISGKLPIRQLVLGGVRFYGWEELVKTSVVA